MTSVTFAARLGHSSVSTLHPMNRNLSHLKTFVPRRVKRIMGPKIRPLVEGPRAVPDFVIVGAQKGGTTSLYKYLEMHPQVLTATRKEVHFFDENFDRGFRWYKSQFPLRREMDRTADALGRPVVTGEASPYYIFHPHAIRRLAKLLPDTKLIVLLRDPVARAFSHYQHQRRRARERLSFAAAIEREADRIRGEIDRLLADESYNSFSYRHFSYVSRGIYADQLERLYRYVSPNQVLVLNSESFFERTQEFYDKTTSFLGLDHFTLPDAKSYNTGRYSRKIPGERALRAYFAPHNRRLYGVLGIDSCWE